jgi:DNA-directed RNA polymerase subunit omega
MTMENAFHNKYSLVKGVARRARQLQSGAPALGSSKSMKACRVAQDEIRSGVVTYVVTQKGARLPLESELQASSSIDPL